MTEELANKYLLAHGISYDEIFGVISDEDAMSDVTLGYEESSDTTLDEDMLTFQQVLHEAGLTPMIYRSCGYGGQHYE